MGFKAWDIKDLSISLNAVPLDSGGYADDEVLSLEWEGDFFDDAVGADGEVTRFRTHDGRATVTLRLMQTSDINDRLTALLQTDLGLPNGAGAGAFKVRDIEGRLVILAERAWVKAPPPWKGAKSPQAVEWPIRLADATFSFIGGR